MTKVDWQSGLSFVRGEREENQGRTYIEDRVPRMTDGVRDRVPFHVVAIFLNEVKAMPQNQAPDCRCKRIRYCDFACTNAADN